MKEQPRGSAWVSRRSEHFPARGNTHPKEGIVGMHFKACTTVNAISTAEKGCISQGKRGGMLPNEWEAQFPRSWAALKRSYNRREEEACSSSKIPIAIPYINFQH